MLADEGLIVIERSPDHQRDRSVHINPRLTRCTSTLSDCDDSIPHEHALTVDALELHELDIVRPLTFDVAISFGAQLRGSAAPPAPP